MDEFEVSPALFFLRLLKLNSIVFSLINIPAVKKQYRLFFGLEKLVRFAHNWNDGILE
jgi:hypothetical protein